MPHQNAKRPLIGRIGVLISGNWITLYPLTLQGHRMRKSAARRTLIKSAMALTAGLFFTAAPVAQAAYPDRPVQWVIPFPPGGPTDVASRVLTNAFEKELGKSFVAVNKPGASGSIGVSQVINSKPDGYTLGMLASPSLTAPFMQPNKPYDLTKDIKPVGVAYVTPLLLVVNPKVLPNVTDVKSLAEVGKKQDLNYTSAATGSTGHLTMELLKKELGFQGTHIAYQGSSPAVTAVLGGDVPVMFSDAVAVLPHIKAGKLRAIAVNVDNFDELPDVKTLASQGLQSTKAVSWAGMFVPNGTPDNATKLLTETLKKVLQDPDVAKRMKSVGAYPVYGDAADLANRIKVDSAIWEQVITENKLNAK